MGEGQPAEPLIWGATASGKPTAGGIRKSPPEDKTLRASTQSIADEALNSRCECGDRRMSLEPGRSHHWPQLAESGLSRAMTI